MDSHCLRIVDAHYRRSVTACIQRKKTLINKINQMCEALVEMRSELDEMILAEKTDFRRFEVGFSNDASILIEDEMHHSDTHTIPIATPVRPSAPPYEDATCSYSSNGGGITDGGFGTGGTAHTPCTSSNLNSSTVKLEDGGFGQDDSSSHSGDSHTTLDLMDDEEEFFNCVDIINVKSTRFKKHDKVIITGGTRYGASEICTVISVTTHKVKVMDRDGNTFQKNKEHVQKVVLLSKNPRPNWLVD